MYYLIYELELMSLVWIKSWTMGGWLVGYWHKIVMYDKFVVGWRDMVVVWVNKIPWNSWWDFMVVLVVMDVIPWISWWDFMVVS